MCYLDNVRPQPFEVQVDGSDNRRSKLVRKCNRHSASKPVATRLSLSGSPRRMMRKWENRASAAAGQVSRARFTIPPYPVSGKP